MPEAQEIYLSQDQVAPHFLSVMVMVDGYISGVKLPIRPADKMLRADYNSNLSFVFASELSRQIDSHTQAEAPQFVEEFSKHFGWGVAYALEHRDLTHGADFEDSKNFLAQFTHVNKNQKAAMLAGYAGARFSQGFTGPGMQALEQMAGLYKLDKAEVIGKEYIKFFTSAMRQLQATRRIVDTYRTYTPPVGGEPYREGMDYPAIPDNAFDALKETLEGKYGIFWDADVDGGKGAFVVKSGGEDKAAPAVMTYPEKDVMTYKG